MPVATISPFMRPQTNAAGTGKIRFSAGGDRRRSGRYFAGKTWPWLTRHVNTIPLQRAINSIPAAARQAYIGSRKLEELGLCKLQELPFSIRVLLEAVLRNCDGYEVTEDDVKNLAGWRRRRSRRVEIPFKPARVVLQDFTGVPAWSIWPPCAAP